MALEFRNDEITQKESFNYDKYKNQSQKLENLSFHDFLLHYNFETHKCWKRVKLWIIQYILKYKSDFFDSDYSNYCHMKLLLHHSFQECENVVTVINESEASSYINIYNECAQLHTHLDDHMKNLKLNENVNADDINEFENQKLSDIELYQFFETLADHIHNEHAVEFKNSDDLDDIDIDCDYDWSSHCELYPDLDERIFWNLAREASQACQDMQAGSSANLQTAQQSVFDAVVQHYQQILSDRCFVLSFKSWD